MIRTSKLSTKFYNKGKSKKLAIFIEQYKHVVQHYVDFLWNNLDETYEVPKFISTKDFAYKTLTQRVIKCASTQACGIVKANVEKARRLVWLINKLKKDNKNYTYAEINLSKLKITKPTLSLNFKCELNSICCDIEINDGFWFLQLKSIGKEFGKLRLPIKPHRQTNYWLKQGNLLTSCLVSQNFIDVRIEIQSKLKKTGKIVGLDQGILSCITLSDGQTSKNNNHHHDLSFILKKLSKRVKGSKGFLRTQKQRENYINWSINQLNFVGIKQINIEKVKNLRKGKRCNRFLSHWTYALIMNKLKRRCEEQKVSVKEQCCVYRSQRCYKCGLVRKSQRKCKVYSCECGYVNDADLNASLNHSINLPSIDFMRQTNLNKEGFLWKPSGVFSLSGDEFTVRHAK